MDLEYSDYKIAFEAAFHPDESQRKRMDEIIKKEKLGQRIPDVNRNTSIADYVWLPLRFDDEMVYIDWKDEWRIEDYE